MLLIKKKNETNKSNGLALVSFHSTVNRIFPGSFALLRRDAGHKLSVIPSDTFR